MPCHHALRNYNYSGFDGQDNRKDHSTDSLTIFET